MIHSIAILKQLKPIIISNHFCMNDIGCRPVGGSAMLGVHGASGMGQEPPGICDRKLLGDEPRNNPYDHGSKPGMANIPLITTC